MVIEQMHFELKRRSKKNYTNYWKGLSDVEADSILNAAIQDYVEIFATGHNHKNYKLGFEVTQQRIDMLSSLLVSDSGIAVKSIDSDFNIYEYSLEDLSYEYRRYVRAKINSTNCTGYISVNIENSGDMNTVLSDFNRKPSLSWGRAVGQIRRGSKGGRSLYVYTNGEFIPDKLYIEYLKEPAEVCLGTYTEIPTLENQNPTGLKNKVECDLPKSYHNLIVDMGVQLYARDLENYNKMQAVKANLLDVSS